MKIRILEKCRIGNIPVNPGDVVDVPETEAFRLEAHGHAEFAPGVFAPPEAEADPEAETQEKKHAKHKAPADEKAKSHRG